MEKLLLYQSTFNSTRWIRNYSCALCNKYVSITFNSTRWIRNEGERTETSTMSWLSTPHGELETTKNAWVGSRKHILSTPHGELETYSFSFVFSNLIYAFNSTRWIRNLTILFFSRQEKALSTPHGELETIVSVVSKEELPLFQLHTVN